MSVPRYEGWLLAGRYRLLSELGRGGMGRVWRAHDELLDRDVAVKEVALPQRDGPEREALLKRAMREARLAARLSHPNIASVYDVVVADERPWIVLQLVPTRSLDEVIIDEGPLPVPTVARIGLQVLDALCTAHASGIVHRDVKPGNILLTGDRESHAVLTDFGLATTLDDQAHRTMPGIVLGTPAYIAPERARGGPATPQTDLWSLGATLYAAVEGCSPFGHSGVLATLTAVLTANAAPFRQAGPLAPVITGLLDKDPARRIDADAAHRQLTHVTTLYERRPTDTAASPIGPAITGNPAAAQDHADAAQGTYVDPPPPDHQPEAAAVPQRWRQAAALVAVAVGVLAMTSWPSGDLADPRPRHHGDPTPKATPPTTAVVRAYPMSEDRTPDSDRRQRPATEPAQPPASAPQLRRQPPGQGKKPTIKTRGKHANPKPLPAGKGHGHGHR